MKTTRAFLLPLVGTLSSCLVVGCNTPPASSPERPNVLFIVVDQFRPDIARSLGGGGIIETPNIDELARSGVVFENAVSTVPLCTPYRGMLMTGDYPTHTGIVVNFINATSQDYRYTLGELFRDAGYETGFIGKWHLGAGGWTNFGGEPLGTENPDVANNFIPPGPGRLGFDDYWAAYNFHMTFNDYYYWGDQPERIQTDEYETDVQVGQAIEFMEERRRDGTPFFLMLSTHPPHPPFTAEATPAGYLEKVPEEIQWDPNVPDDNPQTTDAMRSYYAMAKNTDDNVGRILDYLRDSGLEEQTLVVFTSDHGEMHGSHGYLYKQKPYRESLRVPLIYRLPGSANGGTRKRVPFTPMDHLPTLSALAGISVPVRKDGVSLAGELTDRGSDPERAVLMANFVSDYNTFTTETPFMEWRGVFTGRYTYVRWINGQEELYDNDADTFQMNDLVDDPGAAPVLDEMRTQLVRLLAGADDELHPGTFYAQWYDEQRYPRKDMIPGRWPEGTARR